MARPIKEGLDYFPLDVDIYDDEKLIPVLVKYGLEGEVVTIRLLAAIYRRGYFIEWTDAMKFKLARSTGLDPERIEEIVQELVKWGMFDDGVFAAKTVLTSRGIQKRYLEAKRRKVELRKDLNLVNSTETQDNEAETPDTATETPNNDAKSAQRKGKESKGKESKEEGNNSVGLKNQKKPQPADPPTPDYKGLYALLSGEFNQMILTNAGVTALLANNLSRYGPDAVRYILTRLSDRKPSQYNAPNYVRKVIEGETETLAKIKAGKLDRFGQNPNKKTTSTHPKHIPHRFSRSFELNGKWWFDPDPIRDEDDIYHECIREDNGYITRYPKTRIESLTRGQQQ